MGKQKYVYNEKTLQFEIHKLTPKQKFYRLIANATILVGLSAVAVFLLGMYFPSPVERAQLAEIEQLQYHINSLDKDYTVLAGQLESLHEKDNQVHRMIFNMPAMDSAVWEAGTGGSEEFRYLNSYGVSGQKIKSSLNKVEQLRTRFELQKKSLDDLYDLAIKREERLASIPSIKPVREDKLKRKVNHLSGFGIRLHPVHKVKKFHKGIDFTAPSGTAIQSTGNGRVVEVTQGRKGYGNHVVIDHGFGYKTLYGHMKTIEVKVGERVTKGQQIGTVGSTGTSTAPHLHYEVWINNKAVNPIDYVLDGLTPKEYEEVVKKASTENQSWD